MNAICLRLGKYFGSLIDLLTCQGYYFWAIISAEGSLLNLQMSVCWPPYWVFILWALTGLQKIPCVHGDTAWCHEDPKYLTAKGSSLSIHLTYVVETVHTFLSPWNFQRIHSWFENIYSPPFLGPHYINSLLLSEIILIVLMKDQAEKQWYKY